MKYYLCILFLLMIACQNNDNLTLKYLDKGIERINEHIENIIEWNNSKIEVAYQSNHGKFKFVKANVDQITIEYKNLKNTIKQKKVEVLDKDTKSQTKIEIDLFPSHSAYINLLDSLFPNDSSIQSGFKTQSKYSKTDLNKLNLDGLNVLLNEIDILHHLALDYSVKKIANPPYRLNVNRVAVIPKSKYLLNNEIYQANLYLFSFDSTSKFSIEVDNKIIESQNGKAIYIDTNNISPQLVFKLANLKISSNSTDEEISIPFYFRYKFKGK